MRFNVFNSYLGEGCEQIVERPSQDNIVVDVQEENNDGGRIANTYRKETSITLIHFYSVHVRYVYVPLQIYRIRLMFKISK